MTEIEELAERKKEQVPSLDAWLKEAKTQIHADGCGMYLFHNGVVRRTAKAKVRFGEENAAPVRKLRFEYDAEKVRLAREAALSMPGIAYVRVWLNRGELDVGDDIMLVLVGGDIRPHVVNALQSLVGELKNNCVTEQELV